MRTLRFVWVGKLKEPFWRDAAAHYWARLARSFRLEEVCVKDAAAGSPTSKTLEEGGRLLAQLRPQDYCICLDERGKSMTSKALAAALEGWTADANRTPCFLIGGPFGLTDEVRGRCRELISLSPMTFTHEMARALLLEQLYRAVSILKGAPYHHE